MFFELTTLTAKAGAIQPIMEHLATAATGPRLLGCWYTVLGNAPRIFVLNRAGRQCDHESVRAQAVDKLGMLGAGALATNISVDTYASLPCLPDIETGAFGAIYEIRTYELQPAEALAAARKGWAEVIDVRLGLAPITTVMHSVNGLIPRLVHIYPYRDLAERQHIRDAAIATGSWPPKGGAGRNQVMRTEIAIPASFSPLC